MAIARLVGTPTGPAQPARIISCIPEATAILEALGLGDRVVWASPGVATWDVPDIAPETLAAARPTLIFAAQTDEGGAVPRRLVRKAVARLHPRPAVYALEPHTLGDILSDIKTVGDATGQQAAARALIVALRARIDAVTLQSARALARGDAPRVACLAGTSAAGEPIAAGSWVAELVGLAGGMDVLHGAGRPPRPVPWEQVRRARPVQVIDAADAQAGPRAVDLLERFALQCGADRAVPERDEPGTWR